MSSRQRTSTLFASVLVLLFVLLLGFGATNSFGWVFSDHSGHAVGTPKVNVDPATITATATARPADDDLPPAQHLPRWLQVLFDVLMGVVVVAIGAYLTYALLAWRRVRVRGHERRVEAGEEFEDIDEGALATSLRESAQRSLSALGDDTLGARDAILSCWRDFVANATQAGLQRRPTDTSTEFASRVLSRTGVPPAPVDGLGELARRAMFADWVPTNADVARARDCLQQIVAALSPGAADA